MALNDLLPRFGKASGGQGDFWGDIETFDVDVLAEYLLDDGTMAAAGITFDFE
jgi:hypothetical protein